jgi:hypothetical protein
LVCAAEDIRNDPHWHWHSSWNRYPNNCCWRPCTWAAFGGWFAWSWSEPYTYDYGTTVVYRDNYVYINDEQYASADAYYRQAETIAASVPEQRDAEQVEWMPLGVFAVAEEIRVLNECLCSSGCGDLVTMLAVVLDPKTHELSIVSAGHMSPIWRWANGTAEDLEIDRPGLPLGVIRGIEYEEQIIRFLPGDMLLLYTDGLFEALDPQSRVFSIDRIRSCLEGNDMDVTTTGQTIVSNVVRHMTSSPQYDDICLVCLQRLPVDACPP